MQPEDILPQDGVPAAQAQDEPKSLENQPDYKSFFDSQVEKMSEQKANLEARLSEKLTEAQKLQYEKQIFEIEKQLHQWGVKPTHTQDSIVESVVKAGISPDTEAYAFIKDATKDLSAEDASAFVEVMTSFAKLLGTPAKRPADLNDRPRDEGGQKKSQVGFSAKEIIGENGGAAKANLMELLSNVVAKGI